MTGGPRWRVVVVDDDAQARAAVRAAIAAAGGQVAGESVRRSGALPVVRASRPDAAIVAVGLSDGDGIEAASEIVAAGTPVVLLTRHTEATLVARACAAGVMAYLVKPLRGPELAPALELAIARFSEARALRRRLEARTLVERAKGILMRRWGVDEAEAFGRLRRAAMDSRRPMAEIARAVLLAESVGRPDRPA